VHGVEWVCLKEIPDHSQRFSCECILVGATTIIAPTAKTGILINDLRDQKSCQSGSNISVLIDPMQLKALAQGRYV
jgi:hypothetical protein